MKFPRLSILLQMSATIALSTVVLVAFAFHSKRTLDRVEVGGPYYSQIVSAKDLVADILPPPAYILEAYLLTFQIVNSPENAEREQLVIRLRQTEIEYRARQEYWTKTLPDSRMKVALTKDSTHWADEFFKL